MPRVAKVVFKELTASDFYWINQPGLGQGGGQSYIDFDTSEVSLNDWQKFFEGAEEGKSASGPFWRFSVHNLGVNTTQDNAKLGQRRATSFSVRSQKLPEHSSGGRRLHAWSPHYTDFPPLPPHLDSALQVPFALIANLRVFLIRDENGGYWAGWTRLLPPGVTDDRLMRIFEEKSGLINIGGDYDIDETSPNWPFRSANELSIQSPTVPPTQSDIADVGMASSDAVKFIDWDPRDELDFPEVGIAYVVQKIRKRNQKAANAVRKLYGECQISGSTFVFLTPKGAPYLEVHHLVPLGKGGADSPHNMVVVSAQVHKMLHHAVVSTIDLTKIVDNTLQISINGQPASIKWHPQHAALVQAQNQP